MKPILIDVSKFGGESVMEELQKLVDEAYNQGYKDGARKFGDTQRNRSLEAPPINISEDGMTMGDFDWIDDANQSV